MIFPYEIKELEPELNKELTCKFKGKRSGFVEIGPKKWIMPLGYTQHAAQYYNFSVRADDVWIVSYPRTGTTVTQEMVWMICNNLDFQRSAKQDLTHRFPFFEYNAIQHDDLIDEVRKMNHDKPEYLEYLDFLHKPGYEILQEMESPRFIKTHLPLSLLPPDLIKTCKVIYTARNPKDVCESYYHHNRLIRFNDYDGDFDTYWDYFRRDLLMYSPFWEHLKEGWEVRNESNVFFLFYEDFVKDIKGTIEKLSEFLDKTLTKDQIDSLAEHLSIDNFREKVHFMNPVVPGLFNGSVKKFVRKGQTGSYSLFSEDLLEQADAWINENTKEIGIKFPV